jgi:hypothetical protein
MLIAEREREIIFHELVARNEMAGENPGHNASNHIPAA